MAGAAWGGKPKFPGFVGMGPILEGCHSTKNLQGQCVLDPKSWRGWIPLGPGAEGPCFRRSLHDALHARADVGWEPSQEQEAEASLGNVILFGGTRPSCIIKVLWIHLMVTQ